jgi:FtsP/CotA-like multicopper oxidase with cupredoxin domain
MRMPPNDTNIHFHGFEGPADEENVFLSTLSTPTHACEYLITIPRTQPPGSYFCHAHAHGMAFAEVSGGLSGAWIVELPDAAQLPRADDHVIILRDAVPIVADYPFSPDWSPIVRAGMMHEMMKRPAPVATYDPFGPPPWPSDIPMKAGGVSLDRKGCGGTFAAPRVTIDGARIPVTLTVPAGRTQLLRLLDATADSIKLFRLRPIVDVSIARCVLVREQVHHETLAAELHNVIVFSFWKLCTMRLAAYDHALPGFAI